MTGTGTFRWGAMAAIAGGIASVLEFIIFPINPDVAEMLLLAAYTLTAVGLAALHAAQRTRSGRTDWMGFFTASAGSLLAIIAMTVAVVAEDDLDLLHTVGALLLIIGYMGIGVGALRSRTIPRWCGWAFLAIGPITFLVTGFGGYTTMVFGLFWIAIGYALWSRRTPVPASRSHDPGRTNTQQKARAEA